MAAIHHQVSINVPMTKVYEAISTPEGIGTWWEQQTLVQTDRGFVLEHNPGPEHGVVQLRVVEQLPNRRVEWECISAHPPTSPASAWTGTRFIFEITAPSDPVGPTILDFIQTGYDEQSEFFDFNNAPWGMWCKTSSRSLNHKVADGSLNLKTAPYIRTLLSLTIQCQIAVRDISRILDTREERL